MAVKKNTKKANPTPSIRESAQDIWLAGLGAFAAAEAEGGRLFRNLVKKGQGIEKMSRARVHRALVRAGGLREDAQSAARGALDKVTTPIEKGMTNAMHKLGVPTRREIADLTRRVEELTRVVSRGKGKARARKRARK